MRIDVEDLGDGIDKCNIDKLFEPFFTTRSKGTGLGLAYALQVVKAHNGTITARNRSERGACFSVEVPLNTGPIPRWNETPFDAGR